MYDSIKPPRPPGCGNTRYIQPSAPQYEFRGRPWPKWWGWLYLISAVLCAFGLLGSVVHSLGWLPVLGVGILIFGWAVRGPS